jgi:polysaccharide export outer membrane protein
MLKMIPIQPYRIAIYDVLQIQSTFTIPDHPIDANYLVDAEGDVDLGPTYGKIKVAGMTIEEAKQIIAKKLVVVLQKTEVSVQLAKTSDMQPVTGQYLVGPDGRINLRRYGTLSISGKTVAEAQEAIEKHLAKFFTSPSVSVDVQAFNSQVYYVITDGAGLGDNIKRMPICGNETVLDAIAAVGGLSQVSGKKIWIARPSAGNADKGAVLPVDYAGITQRGATATNYQILPGDRIFIEGDPLVAANNALGKKFAPIERTLGMLSLETHTFYERRGIEQNAAVGEAVKQPQKLLKSEKTEADLSDALYKYLQKVLQTMESP